MKRTMILPVPSGADDYVVTFTGPDPGDPDGYKQFVDGKKPPLPTDNQLTRDLEAITHAADNVGKQGPHFPSSEDPLRKAVARVRAAAGLDND